MNNAYPAGSTLLLSASAQEGYLLSSWSTAAGEIHYADEDTVYLIVPESGATVTASFVKAGADLCSPPSYPKEK